MGREIRLSRLESELQECRARLSERTRERDVLMSQMVDGQGDALSRRAGRGVLWRAGPPSGHGPGKEHEDQGGGGQGGEGTMNQTIPESVADAGPTALPASLSVRPVASVAMSPLRVSTEYHQGGVNVRKEDTLRERLAALEKMVQFIE